MTTKKITRKSDIKPIIVMLEKAYSEDDMSDFWGILETDILQHRVKFPLLEFVGRESNNLIPQQQLLNIADIITAKDYEGGYIIAAIILQSQLDQDTQLIFQKACNIIIDGNDSWCKQKIQIGLATARKNDARIY